MIQQLFYTKPGFILWVYILAAAIACFAKINLDLRVTDTTNYISKINNFIIFKNSFFHLIGHVSLYDAYPLEQYDLYKYSPTFALLFAPFAILPTYVGAVLWAICNALLLYVAVNNLSLEPSKKVFVWWFMLIELITSIQNSQVNPIIAALFIFTFIAFEKKQIVWAALCVVLSAYIKVYGVLGASLFLLYPGKLRFMVYSIGWAALLFVAPMLVLSFDELIGQYKGWQHTITHDHQTRAVDVSIMRFVMGIAHMEFNNGIRLGIQLAGIVVFCLKYMKVRLYADYTFRFLFLACIMIWSIVFNHLAESATYIIAIAGIALWYTTEPATQTAGKKFRWSLVLLIVCFVLSSLSPTDIFPRNIRQLYIVPYALKALPCFVVWALIEYRLLSGNYKPV